MQKQFQVTEVGQEVELSDLNKIAEEAALTEDRVFAELLRMQYFGTAASKGILPYGLRNEDYWTQSRGVLASTGITNASVIISPFRALVGSRVSAGTDADAFRYGIRSAIPTYGNGQAMQLSATVSNNRWDLVYARVDVDLSEAAVPRYVRGSDNNDDVEQLSIFKSCSVVIGVVSGLEATNPSIPDLPVDGAGAYYIPLGAVLLQHPFTLTTRILPKAIFEGNCPVVGVAPSAGGTDVKPSSNAQSLGTWTPANGRPREYMPPSMTGKVERVFGWDYLLSHESVPLNATTVIDDSVNWQNRAFKVTVQVLPSGSSRALAWSGSASGTVQATPSGAEMTRNHVFMGQSFVNDVSAADASSVGKICQLNNANVTEMASGSSITLFVKDTGELCAKLAATSPNAQLFFWIEATGPFSNAI
jgi:hypothetical protein